MINFMDIQSIRDTIETCNLIYKEGWGEFHSGNISYLFTDEEVGKYFKDLQPIKNLPLGFSTHSLAGRYFLVTSTGSAFRNVPKNPEKYLGLIRVSDDGTNYDLMWGYSEGGRPTSEFSAHLLCHESRLSVNPDNRIIMHTHPGNLVTMSLVHEPDENKFTRSLWEILTEGILTFPDGIGVLPWMTCGNEAIGKATAEKMKEFRLVLWAYHGVFAAGNSYDEVIGLTETLEKTAETYLKVRESNYGKISADGLRDIAKAFNLNVRKGVIDQRQ